MQRMGLKGWDRSNVRPGWDQAMLLDGQRTLLGNAIVRTHDGTSFDA